MDKTFILETPATPSRLYEVVGDLSTYPQWIDFVHNVEAITPVDGTVDAAWWVTLRARLGPLARSKRLRMIKAVDNPPDDKGRGLVRFERSETDGRQHAQWILEVAVEPGPSAGASQAQCRLAYDGGLWVAPLDLLLDQAAAQSTERLSELVSQASTE